VDHDGTASFLLPDFAHSLVEEREK